MKSAVAPYETAAWCVRIECVGGLILRLTTYPFDLTMSNATVYETDSGYEQTAYAAGTGLSPPSIDIEGFVGIAGITKAQIISGVFDNARVYIFKCDYLNPVEDYEPVTLGFFGKTGFVDEKYRIEGMGLTDALNQSVGFSVAPQCPKQFGGQEFAGCKIALAPITATGSVTHITSGTVFRDSSRTEAADWFAAGTVEFTSGANVGLKPIEIKSYTLDGTITTFEPPYYAVEIGDTLSIVPGCRKRLEDCRDKWDNVVNFGGFSFVILSSQYAQIGGTGR